MIKACVFDMFETLVSLFDGRRYFSEDIACDLGIPEADFRQVWHATEKDRTLGRCAIEQAAESALKVLGCHTPENVNTICRKRRESLADTFAAENDQTLGLLSELKRRGIRIGLVSNCFSDERDFIRQSAFFPFFDAAELSCEAGIAKPDLRLYYGIAEKLGVMPEECLYVGDGGSMELYAAREAGMTAVQAVWFRSKAFEPHVPCGICPEFPQAADPAEVIRFL